MTILLQRVQVGKGREAKRPSHPRLEEATDRMESGVCMEERASAQKLWTCGCDVCHVPDPAGGHVRRQQDGSHRRDPSVRAEITSTQLS